MIVAIINVRIVQVGCLWSLNVSCSSALTCLGDICVVVQRSCFVDKFTLGS